MLHADFVMDPRLPPRTSGYHTDSKNPHESRPLSLYLQNNLPAIVTGVIVLLQQIDQPL